MSATPESIKKMVFVEIIHPVTKNRVWDIRITQVVGCHAIATGLRVRSQLSSVSIRCGRCGSRTGISQNFFGLSLLICIPILLHAHYHIPKGVQ